VAWEGHQAASGGEVALEDKAMIGKKIEDALNDQMKLTGFTPPAQGDAQ